MELSQALQTYRKKRGLTQKKLSELSGVPVVTIQQYERGARKTAKFENLSKIAGALNIPVSVLTNSGSQELTPGELDVVKNRINRLIDTAEEMAAEGDRKFWGRLDEYGTKAIRGIVDGTIVPTVKDVEDIADILHISLDWLLGLTEDPNIPLNDRSKELLTESAYYSYTDFTLCVLHIRKFINRDLGLPCTAEEAEAIANLALVHIGADKLISFAQLVDSVSPEIRAAALAVLRSGAPDRDPKNENTPREDPEA